MVAQKENAWGHDDPGEFSLCFASDAVWSAQKQSNPSL
jgi:nuclear transport factor 2 (NTF2) superfamily protein